MPGSLKIARVVQGQMRERSDSKIARIAAAFVRGTLLSIDARRHVARYSVRGSLFNLGAESLLPGREIHGKVQHESREYCQSKHASKHEALHRVLRCSVDLHSISHLIVLLVLVFDRQAHLACQVRLSVWNWFDDVSGHVTVEHFRQPCVLFDYVMSATRIAAIAASVRSAANKIIGTTFSVVTFTKRMP